MSTTRWAACIAVSVVIPVLAAVFFDVPSAGVIGGIAGGLTGTAVVVALGRRRQQRDESSVSEGA